MDAITSQITSLTIVYSIVYSDADQRKHQSSVSLAFVWGIHRRPVNSPQKWPVTRKMFPFDDVIMWITNHVPWWQTPSLGRHQSNIDPFGAWDYNLWSILHDKLSCNTNCYPIPVSRISNSSGLTKFRAVKPHANERRRPINWHHAKRRLEHYGDVIMDTIVSPITNLTIVYSTVYSDADQRKHQSSASLAFARGIHREPVNSPHKGPVTRKMFPFDDVIMDVTARICVAVMITDCFDAAWLCICVQMMLEYRC